MFKNFSPNLFFSMGAVTVVIFAPFIMLFLPILYSFFVTEKYSDDLFLLNPINNSLLLFACLLLAGTFGLLAYKRTTFMYITGVLLFFVSFSVGYLSTQNYLEITNEQIERHYFLNADRYEWSELAEVYYEYVVGRNAGTMTLITKSGEQLVIKDKELTSQARSYIYHYSRQNDVVYIEREKKD